ncbi:hypothetical protein JCM19274_4102 [Algibacter lectus]|uniref:Uncharacterized protein n=1 Tax=Algibacter lectus TaxID=221126 RepID=A0A090X570_9FLAO|nr:hypothetical protein JCM19274_4102 [Algibacter lectus]
MRTIWGGVSFNRVQAEFGDVFLQHLKKYSDKFIKEDLLVISNKKEQMSQSKLDTDLKSNASSQILKTTQKGKFLVDGIASELFMI